MIEKDIEALFVKQATQIGALAWKLTSPSTSGVPDRIFVRNGKVVFVELKRPNGKLRKLQEYRRCQLQKHGVRVECLSDKESVIRFISEMEEGETGEIHTT